MSLVLETLIYGISIMSRKTASICLTALVLFCALATRLAVADTQGDAPAVNAGPSMYYALAGSPQFAVISSDGIQFIRHSQEPAACTAALDGKASMTTAAQLCVCDGAHREWKTVGTGTVCVW